MSDDYHPELAEYEPDDYDPPRSVNRQRAMRLVGLVALIALVLPGVLVTIYIQGNTASAACDIVVANRDPDATDSAVRFEFGVDGPAWYCYSVRFGGAEILLQSLGLIPGLSPQQEESPGVRV